MDISLVPAFAQEWIDNADQTVFLTDFDGTLVHFAPHPDKVIVPRSLIQNIQSIARKNRIAFAVVTGRSLYKLDLLLENTRTIAVGSHGAEWRAAPDAKIEIMAPPFPLPLRRALEDVSNRHGCIFEDKIYTVSLHLPFEEAHKDLYAELALALGSDAEACLIRKVERTYEILQKSVNKGSGIRHLMQQPGFKGKRPFYVGDDIDSDASLAVIDQLGGFRLGVSSPSLLEPEKTSHFMGVETAREIIERLAQL